MVENPKGMSVLDGKIPEPSPDQIIPSVVKTCDHREWVHVGLLPTPAYQPDFGAGENMVYVERIMMACASCGVLRVDLRGEATPSG